MDAAGLSVPELELEAFISTRVRAAWMSSIVRSVLARVLVKDRAAVRSAWLRDSMAVGVIEVSGLMAARLPGAKSGLSMSRVCWFAVVVDRFRCCGVKLGECVSLWKIR